MNQAARLAPALRRACDLSRALLPPSASLQSGRVQPHRRRRLWPEGSGHGPLVSTSSASGVECPVGTPLHPWAPAITSAAADGGSVSRSACAPALGSGRFAPCGGAAWPLAARNRGLAPRGRGDRAPAEQPRGPLRASRCAPSAALNAGTDAGPSLHRLNAIPLRPADRSGVARSDNIRAPYASRSPLRCETRAAANCVRLLRRLTRRAQTGG